MSTVRMIVGDIRDVMATLPDNSADVLITSPPFLEARDYLTGDHPEKAREIGHEATPAAFLDVLYQLTAEFGRLIPEWGSICVELGDKQSGSGGAGGDYDDDGWREGQPRFGKVGGPGWPLDKSACGIPQGYYLGLIYGRNPISGVLSPAGQWRARNWLVWARPNPSVGSLGKRNPVKRTGDQKFRPACSYITVACRGTGRYFDLDAVRTEPSEWGARYGAGAYRRPTHKANPDRADNGDRNHEGNPAGAPPLDWHTDHLDGDWLWRLVTAPYKGAHYATYPLTLPRRLILAMCPQRVCTTCGWPSERITTAEYEPHSNGRKDENKGGIGLADVGARAQSMQHGRATLHSSTLGFTDCGHNTWRPGTVLDPFAGTGTTAVAAALENRDATLIDLDPRNVALVDRRLREAVHVTAYTIDGNTHTWTCEPALPNQRDQHDGQATMLDLWGEPA